MSIEIESFLQRFLELLIRVLLKLSNRPSVLLRLPVVVMMGSTPSTATSFLLREGVLGKVLIEPSFLLIK